MTVSRGVGIKLLLSKALLYGALALFITAIYLGIVVGLGRLLGLEEEPNLGLSILATGLIAVTFQRFKDRTRRIANRLVYGERATPYEVLARFSTTMGGSYAQEELLSQMAATLAEGTGASSAHVWVKAGNKLKLAASFHGGVASRGSGDDDHPAGTVTVDNFEMPHADPSVAV